MRVFPTPAPMVDWTNPITRGLVAWWPLANGAGAGVRDVVAENNGVINGTVSWAGGPSGTAPWLNGSTNYATITTGKLNLSGDFTWSAWAKFTGFGAGYSMIISSGQTYAYLACTNATEQFTFDTSSNTTFIFGPALTVNKWHHVAVVRRSGIDYGYVDGSLRSTKADTTAISSTYFEIGRYAPGANNYLNGSASNIRIHARAIDAREVAQLYTNPHEGQLQSRTSRWYIAFRAAWAARANQIIGGSTT